MNKILELFDRVHLLIGRKNVSIVSISKGTGITRPTLYKMLREKKCTVENLGKVLDYLESIEV